MDLKREFLGYLRSVYGGDPMPMSQTSLPPLDSPVIYPAFRNDNLNSALMSLGGNPLMNQQMQLGMMPRMQMGRQRSAGASELMQAQDTLLGR